MVQLYDLQFGPLLYEYSFYMTCMMTERKFRIYFNFLLFFVIKWVSDYNKFHENMQINPLTAKIKEFFAVGLFVCLKRYTSTSISSMEPFYLICN